MCSESREDVATYTRRVIVPDLETLKRIVRTPHPFTDKDEEENCRRMVVDELTEEEQSIAARTSFAFWAWEKLEALGNSKYNDNEEISVVRIRMAMCEARRHFVGEAANYESALERFKANLVWRKDTKVNLMRCCFAVSADEPSGELSNSLTTLPIQLTKQEADECERFENLLQNDLTVQKMAVRGHDKKNRAIVVKCCREQKWPTDEDGDDSNSNADFAYFLTQIYIVERAIAVTELRNLGQTEKLTAIFDFGTYDSGNSPPVRVIVDTVRTLQANYPERLGKGIVLDAPFWMQAVLKLIQPFLAEETRDKLMVLGSVALSSLWYGSSDDTREAALREIIDPDQAMPFLLSDAKLTSPIDVNHQLRSVPFHELYDFGCGRETA